MNLTENIKDLLGQLDESTLKDVLASIKKKRSQKKYKTFKEEYAEIVRRCATRKPPRRKPPI